MRKFLITVVVLNSIIWFGLSSLVKADDYNTAVIGHVISETIKNTDIDTSYIMEQELEKLAHKFVIDSIYIIQAYLPEILDGVVTDLKLKTDQKYKEIKKYFKEFNNAIFENKLSPFGQIQIKDLKREKCVGQVITFEWKRKGTRMYKLEMLPAYPEKRDFMDTLVHEMVHLYQMQNLGDTGNHNEVFWSFSPKVNYIGLQL